MEMGKVINICWLLVNLVNIVSPIKYIVMLTLARFGLVDPPAEAIYARERTSETPSNANNNYILMSYGPALVPVPTTVVTASIKRQLQVLKYIDFRKKHEDTITTITSSCFSTCVVCWDSIEASEEIRELCNCDHVFHRECLDRWVDEGRVTCPLCRSMLIPFNMNPYALLRNGPSIRA